MPSLSQPSICDARHRAALRARILKERSFATVPVPATEEEGRAAGATRDRSSGIET
jgi:hypothetical protein